MLEELPTGRYCRADVWLIRIGDGDQFSSGWSAEPEFGDPIAIIPYNPPIRVCYHSADGGERLLPQDLGKAIVRWLAALVTGRGTVPRGGFGHLPLRAGEN